MARLTTEGFEMGDLMWFDQRSDATAVTALPTPWRSQYCSKFSGYGAGTPDIAKILPAALSEVYLRQRILITGTGVGTMRLPAFYTSDTSVMTLYTDVIGRICMTLGSSSTVVAQSIQAMVVDQWYEMEIYFKESDANGRLVIKMDNGVTPWIDYTGDTKPSTGTTFDNLRWKNGGVSCYICLDDIAINDTSGGVDDGWPGDGVVEKIWPIGNGAHNNWHGSDGDDVDNWDLVNEFPKDDDVTYVYHDGSGSGTQDQYDMSDTWDNTNKVIDRIYAECRARKTSAVNHQLKIGILAAGGVDRVSARRDLLVNCYTRIVGNEEFVNPVDSSAWEKADIDALEFVAEVA